MKRCPDPPRRVWAWLSRPWLGVRFQTDTRFVEAGNRGFGDVFGDLKTVSDSVHSCLPGSRPTRVLRPH